MITSIRTAVVAAVLAIALLLSGGLLAQQFDKAQFTKAQFTKAQFTEAQFTEDQREEMGEIIRDYLLENPEILREVIQALEAKEQEAGVAAMTETIRERGDELYRGEHDLVAGNPDGSVTMVEFFDYNCGYCKRAMSDVLALIESDDDLRVVFKEWPILGEGSRYAARAALASRKQGKYWEFHQALMAARSVDETTTLEVAERIGLDVEQLKVDMEAPEVADVIEGNMQLASAFGIQGTPAFFVDDQLIPGAVGHEALAQAIGAVREAGGCTIC